MNTFYFGKPIKNFDDLIQNFQPKDFNSIRTSTVPLIDYWKKSEIVIDFYKSNVCRNIANPCICFEYPTKSYQRNNPSFTDVMIFDDCNSLAIEAKHTEKLYKSVEEWNYNETDNRNEVINHWLKSVNERLKSKISPKEILSFDYQMLHRISSACYLRKEHTYVIYQIFLDESIESHITDYKTELKKYSELIKEKEIIKPISLFIQETKVSLALDSLMPNDIAKTIAVRNIYKILESIIYEIH